VSRYVLVNVLVMLVLVPSLGEAINFERTVPVTTALAALLALRLGQNRLEDANAGHAH
jgi:hypothetical protein